MLLDLSEIFVCPRCRPTQGLVVLVDEIRDRRVVRGHLGCPECEGRFPVERGVLRFGAGERGADAGSGGPDADDGEPPAGRDRPPRAGEDVGTDAADVPSAALFRGASRREAGLRLGALLGLPEAGGPFLLGPGLGPLAPPLADMAEDEEVLALVEPSGGGTPRDPGGRERESGAVGDGAAGRRVTRIVGVAGDDLPVFSGRLGGAALLGGTAGALEEAVRAVRAGGRVAVVEPGEDVHAAVEELGVEVAARDERALVGVRRA